MGYDTTISIYDAQGKYLGDIIDDITFRAFRNLIDFSYKNQTFSEKDDDFTILRLKNHCIFGDMVCKKDVLKSFQGTDFENEIAKIILDDEEIGYYSITSV